MAAKDARRTEEGAAARWQMMRLLNAEIIVFLCHFFWHYDMNGFIFLYHYYVVLLLYTNAICNPNQNIIIIVISVWCSELFHKTNIYEGEATEN